MLYTTDILLLTSTIQRYNSLAAFVWLTVCVLLSLKKKTDVAGTCTMNGGLRNTSSGDTVGTEPGYKRKQGRDGQGKTGWTSSDEIWRTWRTRTLLGMKPKNWRQTEQNGVNVWPNASIWMQDELRSKVRYQRKPQKLLDSYKTNASITIESCGDCWITFYTKVPMLMSTTLLKYWKCAGTWQCKTQYAV